MSFDILRKFHRNISHLDIADYRWRKPGFPLIKFITGCLSNCLRDKKSILIIYTLLCNNLICQSQVTNWIEFYNDCGQENCILTRLSPIETEKMQVFSSSINYQVFGSDLNVIHSLLSFNDGEFTTKFYGDHLDPEEIFIQSDSSFVCYGFKLEYPSIFEKTIQFYTYSLDTNSVFTKPINYRENPILMAGVNLNPYSGHYDVAFLEENGWLFAHQSNDSLFINKWDIELNEEWVKVHTGKNLRIISQGLDSTFYVIYSNDLAETHLLIIDKNGNEINDFLVPSDRFYLESILNKNGSLLVLNKKRSQWYFTKFNQDWTIEWERNIGSLNQYNNYKILETIDGGYAIGYIAQKLGQIHNFPVITRILKDGTINSVYYATILADTCDYTEIKSNFGDFMQLKDSTFLLSGSKYDEFTNNDGVGYLINISNEQFDDFDNDGYAAGIDCDDNDPNLNPAIEEICNDIDDNCNGIIDEGFIIYTYYDDIDGDGFGDPTTASNYCEQLTGAISNGDDCDDNNPDINPDQTEEPYNGLDDDCNPNTFDDDIDGDGFLIVDDCDDNNEEINPSAEELCDGLDNNCNALIDDGLIKFSFYADFDNDGFGNISDEKIDCKQPLGYVLNNTDCDDNNPNINPDAEEIYGNNIDDDCDGNIDGLDGVHEIDGYTITIGPNPASTTLFIKINRPIDYKVKLLGINGDLIIEQRGVNELNLSQLDSGTYLLILEDSDSVQLLVEKFFVIK